MKFFSRPHSFWHEGVPLPLHLPLRDEIAADVCVIGAGIAGLTTARLLCEAGLSVVILEALDLAAGETSRSTSHIAVPDDGYWLLEREHGLPVARQVADSFAKAIDLIESIVEGADIRCDFERVDGILVSCTAHPDAALKQEYDAARRAGVEVEFQAQAPGSYARFGPCLRFTGQAQMNPFKYLLGLVAALPNRCALFSDTRALSIDERDDRVLVRTAGGSVTAGAAVVATNTPFNERFGLHLRQSAYQTYVIASLVPKGSLPRCLLWDDADPYHYVRLANYDHYHDVLIIGGEDHKTGHEPDPPQSFDALERWASEHVPGFGTVQWRWSGEIMEPVDSLANLGREPGSEHIFVISGDSGNGITHATIGAMIVSALVQQRTTPWTDTYDPARSRISHAAEFAREQAEIAAQYTDWLTGGDVKEIEAIQPGSGALVRRGMSKLAVYRDINGEVYASSAVCPHMGCIVQWNPAEKSWDCPCHGSRFSADGALLHGPADRRLTSLNEPEKLEPPPSVAAD